MLAMLIWLVLLLRCSCLASNVEVEAYETEVDSYVQEKIVSFDRELTEATQRVVKTVDYKVPDELDPDFSHSFIPGTGYLNRQELVIDGVSVINEVSLLQNGEATDWDVVEYRGNEFIVASNDAGLTFIRRFRGKSVVTGAAIGKCLSVVHLHLPLSDGTVTLFLAALIEEESSRKIAFFVLDGDEPSPSLVGEYPVSKDVHHLNTIFIPHRDYNFIIAERSPELPPTTQFYSKVYNAFLRDDGIQMREVADLPCAGQCKIKPFHVNGEALVAIASTGMRSQLLRFDDKTMAFVLVQKFDTAMDVETFRIGFYYFLAWLYTDSLEIYTYNGADFSLWRRKTGEGFFSIDIMHVPTCRDEVLLVLARNDGGETALDLYKYYGHGTDFVFVNDSVCTEWKLKKNIRLNSPHTPKAKFSSLSEAQIACQRYSGTCCGIELQTSRGRESVYELQQNPKNKGATQRGFDYIERATSSGLSCLQKYNLDWTSIRSLTLVNTSILLGKSSSSNNVLFIEALVHLEDQPDPIWLDNVYLMRSVKSLEADIEDQQRIIEDARAILENAVSNSGNQNLYGGYTFTGEVITPFVQANQVDPLGNLRLEDSNLTVEDFKDPFGDIRDRLNGIEGTTNDLEAGLDNIVYLNENADIFGLKKFESPASVKSILSGVLHIESILNTDVSKLLNDLFMLGGSKELSGIKTMSQGAWIKGDLETDSLNGLDFSKDIVNIRDPQLIDGKIDYRRSLISHDNIEVDGLVGGMKLATDAVTLKGSRKINVGKIFQNKVMVKGDVGARLVDDVDVSTLAPLAVTLSGVQRIQGVKHLGHLAATEGKLIINGLLNGVDVPELDSKVVRTNMPIDIIGNKFFEQNLEFRGDLEVTGTVNGVRIPQDFFTTDTEQQINGLKRFNGPIVVDKLTVDGLLDGLRLPDDVVTLTTEQNGLGKKRFVDGVFVDGDIEVTGTIDSVDVSELASVAIPLNQDISVELDVVASNDLGVGGNFVVYETVNGVKLSDLVEDLIYSDDSDSVVTAEKGFTKKLFVDKMEVRNTLNNFNMDRDFVDLYSNQEISGTKTFEDDVTVNGDLVVKGLINEVDLLLLNQDRVSLSDSDDIMGKWRFVDPVDFDKDLHTGGLVDGVDMANVVLKSTDQVIYGNISWDHFHADHLHALDVSVKGPFGGIDIDELVKNRLDLTRGRSMGLNSSQPLNLNSAEITGDVTVGKVNGRDLEDFLKDLVKSGLKQKISGQKEFTRAQINGKIRTKGKGLHGLFDVLSNAIPIYDDNVQVTGLLDFDNVQFNDLEIDGNIAGVDILVLRNELVTSRSDGDISGKKIFDNGFVVNGNLRLGSVNGEELNDLLLKYTEQDISGKYKFKNVGVGNDLTTALLNGLDLPYFYESIMMKNARNLLEGDLTIQNDLTTKGDATIKGTLNGLDLVDVFSKIVFLYGDQDIEGHKTFRSAKIEGDLNSPVLNGKILRPFLEDLVFLDSEQVIKGNKKLTNVATNVVTTQGDAEVTGTVSGFNLPDLIDHAIYTSPVSKTVNMKGNNVFAQDLRVLNHLDAEDGVRINGIDISEQAFTLSGDQRITGFMTFESAASGSDVSAGLLNGMRLDDLVRDTLLESGRQEMRGKKSLNNAYFNEDVNVDGLVNGVDLSVNVVPLKTNQRLASKRFSSDVAVDVDMQISGLINGIDLSDLALHALYPHIDGQVVTAQYLLKDVIFRQNVDTDGTVDGVDLSELRPGGSNTDSVKDYLSFFQIRTKSDCEEMNRILALLRSAYKELDSWVWYGVLDEEPSVSSSVFVSTSTKAALATSNVAKFERKCAKGVKVYDLSHRAPLLIDNIGYGKSSPQDVQFFTYDRNEYLAVAGQDCSGVSSSVWKFNVRKSKYELFTTVEYPATRVRVESTGTTAFLVFVGGEADPTVVAKMGGERGLTILAEFSAGVADASVFNHNNVTYLVLCRSNGRKQNSQIYAMDGTGVVLVHTLCAAKCLSSTHFVVNGAIFVSLALESTTSMIWARQQATLEVFLLSAIGWSSFHKTGLSDKLGPIDLEAFVSEKDVYILSTVKGYGFKFYKYIGVSGFTQVMDLHDSKAVTGRVVDLNGELALVSSRDGLPTIIYNGLFLGFKSNLPDYPCCDLDLALDHFPGPALDLDQFPGPKINLDDFSEPDFVEETVTESESTTRITRPTRPTRRPRILDIDSTRTTRSSRYTFPSRRRFRTPEPKEEITTRPSRTNFGRSTTRVRFSPRPGLTTSKRSFPQPTTKRTAFSFTPRPWRKHDHTPSRKPVGVPTRNRTFLRKTSRRPYTSGSFNPMLLKLNNAS